MIHEVQISFIGRIEHSSRRHKEVQDGNSGCGGFVGRMCTFAAFVRRRIRLQLNAKGKKHAWRVGKHALPRYASFANGRMPYGLRRPG